MQEIADHAHAVALGTAATSCGNVSGKQDMAATRDALKKAMKTLHSEAYPESEYLQRKIIEAI